MFIRVDRATGRHLNIVSAAVALSSKLQVGELELLLLGWLGVAALDVLALVGGRTADSLPWWVAGQLAPLPGSSALCFPSGYVGVSLAGIPTKTPKTLGGKNRGKSFMDTSTRGWGLCFLLPPVFCLWFCFCLWFYFFSLLLLASSASASKP